MSETDRVLSYNDLKSFDSIQDARAHLIERKVTELMRGSFSEWIAFFRDRLKLTMSYLDPFMDVLVETCERRNLLVHNAGVVNSIYLSKVAPNLRKGVKKGTQVELTKGYLDERIDYFELHSMLIAAELWKQLGPTDEKRADALPPITYDHLLAGRWKISEGLAFFQMNDKRMPEPYRLTGTLNYWLSMKRQGKSAAIKPDLETADFSAKGMRYQLGLLSLQEKNDAFFAVLPRAIRAKEITADELARFPILNEMRSDSRMLRFLKGSTQPPSVATVKDRGRTGKNRGRRPR